jgi:hypothetical protein
MEVAVLLAFARAVGSAAGVGERVIDSLDTLCTDRDVRDIPVRGSETG